MDDLVGAAFGDGRSMRRIRGDGVDLAVFERGRVDGPTVVLVHGYPDTHRVWDGVAAGLEHRFHVVTYDVRGSGASTAPSRREGYRLEHLAADLRAVIHATAGGKPAHVVGHDWGSIQAWELVTDPSAASILASFTSISGPCLDHVGHWMADALRSRGRGALRQALKSWYVGAFHVPGLAEWAWRSGVAQRLLARIERVERVDSRPAAEDAVRGVELYRANIVERLRAPRARHAVAPVQLVILDADRYVGAAMSRAAIRWSRPIEVVELRGGHWAVRATPAPIARAIEGMVESVQRRQALIAPS